MIVDKLQEIADGLSEQLSAGLTSITKELALESTGIVNRLKRSKHMTYIVCILIPLSMS